MFPQSGILISIILMNTLSILPSLLKIISKSSSETVTTKKRRINFAINIFAFLLQLSVIVAIISVPPFTLNLKIFTLAAILLTSFSYLINFIDLDFVTDSKILLTLKKLKKNSQRSINRSLIITSIWKIGLTILLTYLYHPNLFTENLNISSDIFTYSIIIQIISSVICIHTGVLACKLYMQLSSFSLPLTIITPIAVAIFMNLCNLPQYCLKHNIEVTNDPNLLAGELMNK